MTKSGRRLLIAGASAAALCFTCRAARTSPLWHARQFHNEPSESYLHGFLVQMWTAVRAETNGRLDVTVYPQNAGIPGSDPAALDMLRSGELQFFTLMGGILGNAVPVAEI